jgi:hypothetical protein
MRRRSREQILKDIEYLERICGITKKGQDSSQTSYKNVGVSIQFIPPEILQEMQEKREKERTTPGKSIQEPLPRLSRAGMERVAKRLLGFYILDLLANYKELSFIQMVDKVNQKFEGLVDDKFVANFLLDKKLGKDSFFECYHKKFKDRFTHFFKYSLKKKMMNFIENRKKYDNILDFLYHKELHKKRIRELELKSLMDPTLSYRVNENSPFWSLYQVEMDMGIIPSELIALFPDKGSINQYVV